MVEAVARARRVPGGEWPGGEKATENIPGGVVCMGPIPPQLGDFNEPGLAGSFRQRADGIDPAGTGQPRHLAVLRVNNNDLTGPDSSGTRQPGLLSELNLSGIDLVRSIPEELDGLVNLTTINLGQTPSCRARFRARRPISANSGRFSREGMVFAYPTSPNVLLWLEGITK